MSHQAEWIRSTHPLFPSHFPHIDDLTPLESRFYTTRRIATLLMLALIGCFAIFVAPSAAQSYITALRPNYS